MPNKKKITVEKFLEKAINIHGDNYDYSLVNFIDMNNKIICEFYGDFWHWNPKIYNGQDINYLNKKSFSKLYEATFEKEKTLIANGYKIISIWENDWNKEMRQHA